MEGTPTFFLTATTTASSGGGPPAYPWAMYCAAWNAAIGGVGAAALRSPSICVARLTVSAPLYTASPTTAAGSVTAPAAARKAPPTAPRATAPA